MTGQVQNSWESKMIKLGVITMSLAVVANFGPPLYLWLGLVLYHPLRIL